MDQLWNLECMLDLCMLDLVIPHIKFQVQPFIGNNGFIVVYNYMICHLQFDL